jgi:hypothetical protein
MQRGAAASSMSNITASDSGREDGAVDRDITGSGTNDAELTDYF